MHEHAEVVVASLDVGGAELGALAALLAPDETQRAARFVFERDRCRYTVARARLRQLLGERLGVSPESVQLAYAPAGKPALAPRYERDLRFNLSHCGGVAAYAFAEGREVGVDVEEVRVLPDADDVAKRFFSRRERSAYLRLPRRERPQGFFNCWTRKEAFIKALGSGLSYPLDGFDVSLAPGRPARILRIGRVPASRCGWTLHSFLPGPGLVGAVALQS
jgi:4'-phosphopantetheinyl transferase